ncbi:regulatory-associated protein of TOR 1-like [Dorcoceras hygrometricum]|uniref:Regulatory-associated protein of TOR 1-like n=1 Tax=Dorcoceras hygrometricum TaxID=472368 RepID=A0A2Z7C4U0_9LAMI|nr:regulatory-associated protein of TOR 1-like [Dorcoceras hygrometricum]
MGATHSSQHTAPDAKHRSTCCCPTHEVWELPTPLIVANRSQQEDEVRELPAQPLVASWYAQINTTKHKRHGSNRSELNMINACMQHRQCPTQKHIQRCKAYTAVSIIAHDQSTAVKQAYICTSSILSYNYHKEVPSNTDLTPAKPNTDSSSETVAQKLTNWELQAQPNLSYPSNITEGSKQSTREMSSHTSPASRKLPKQHQTKRLSKRSPALPLLLQSDLSTVDNRRI